jgi:hypothetical protein
MKTVWLWLIECVVTLTDYFLEVAVDGIRSRAIFQQRMSKGLNTEADFCEYLCKLQNRASALCQRDHFGNETHTTLLCEELMTREVNDSTMKEYENIYAYKYYFMITFIVLGVIITLVMFVFLLYFARQVVFDLYHWWMKPKGYDRAEYEVKLARLQVEKAHWAELQMIAEDKKRLTADRMLKALDLVGKLENTDTNEVITRLQLDNAKNQQTARDLRSKVKDRKKQASD